MYVLEGYRVVVHSAHGLEVGPGDKRSLSADLLRAKQYFYDLCLTQPFDVEKGSLGRHVYGLSCVKTGFLELFDITSAHPLVGQLVNLQPLALLSGTPGGQRGQQEQGSRHEGTKTQQTIIHLAASSLAYWSSCLDTLGRPLGAENPPT